MTTKIPKREVITVRLPDGYRVEISNRAKKECLKISDVVRLAIKKYLHL